MDKWREEERSLQSALKEKLMRFMKGDEHAVAFCMGMVYVAHLWDDLVDGDRSRTGREISDGFRICLVDIQANPFYRANSSSLLPVIMNSIMRWQDANFLEHGSDHDKHLAYGHRASFLDLLNFCAMLVGGFSWAEEVGPEMRRMYEEPLESFMEEMACLTR